MTHLSPEQRTTALESVAAATRDGFHADAVYVAESGVTVLTNFISASRWRERFGDNLSIGVPLNIIGGQQIGGAA